MDIVSHRDLKVYQAAAALRRGIFKFSITVPAYERFELAVQIRSSSRSVCAAIAEAWRKRHFPANWVSKISDAEQEAAETQLWIETALECEYMTAELAQTLMADYEAVLGQLANMASHPEKWTPRARK